MTSLGYEDPQPWMAGVNDEDIVSRARTGDARAADLLMLRYRPLVENKAKAFYLIGADHDDVVQEGMIGLYKAIRDFRCDRRAKFRPFAELCVTRQIITAVKTATRQKHFPMNGYVSLNQSLSGEEGDGTLVDVLADADGVNPEDQLFGGTVPRNLRDAVRHLLSDLEAKVLECYLEGKSYREMSRELACRAKSIDNALQRIKRKIHSYLQD
jgi:RNA polymerase sporulation-specific sigma factor